MPTKHSTTDQPPLPMPLGRVLIAGCGDLGCAIAQRLLQDGFEVHGLRRSQAELPSGVRPVRADVTQPQSLTGLAALAPEILVYAVAANAQSDDDYRANYVDGLRNVLQALRDDAQLQHVFFVSSTRVYGQSSDALLDEDTPAQPADFGGRRLLEAEGLLAHAPCPGTALRLSGIYGPGRTRMLQLALQPQHWPPLNTNSNRIHRDDAADFIAFLVRRAQRNEPLPPCYIVSDDAPAPIHEVLAWLARRLDPSREIPPMQPVAGSKRVSNARMRQTGFSLRYPDYRSGYAALLELDR